MATKRPAEAAKGLTERRQKPRQEQVRAKEPAPASNTRDGFAAWWSPPPSWPPAPPRATCACRADADASTAGLARQRPRRCAARLRRGRAAPHSPRSSFGGKRCATPAAPPRSAWRRWERRRAGGWVDRGPGSAQSAALAPPREGWVRGVARWRGSMLRQPAARVGPAAAPVLPPLGIGALDPQAILVGCWCVRGATLCGWWRAGSRGRGKPGQARQSACVRDVLRRRCGRGGRAGAAAGAVGRCLFTFPAVRVLGSPRP